MTKKKTRRKIKQRRSIRNVRAFTNKIPNNKNLKSNFNNFCFVVVTFDGLLPVLTFEKALNRTLALLWHSAWRSFRERHIFSCIEGIMRPQIT